MVELLSFLGATTKPRRKAGKKGRFMIFPVIFPVIFPILFFNCSIPVAYELMRMLVSGPDMPRIAESIGKRASVF